MKGVNKSYGLYALLIFFLILNISFWQYSHRQKIVWPNIPKPASELGITTSFLGDRALAYRVWGLALQNFGSSGGDVVPLKDYDYPNLGRWLILLDRLDSQSDYVPFLSGYFFGSTQNPEQLPPVIDYLAMVGSRPQVTGDKWRWLAQAMYLARHRMQDMPRALALAKRLGDVYRPGMPAWTLQMQALIADDMGDSEAAYVLLKSMLATETGHMDPAEVRFMVDYICKDILTPLQATHEPICAPAPK